MAAPISSALRAVREGAALLRVLRLVDISEVLNHYIDTLSEVVPVLSLCVLFVVLIAYVSWQHASTLLFTD